MGVVTELFAGGSSADLLTIGAFARLVGLTPSALRFYDDCGLLPPRKIDPLTGYRYYAPDQQRAGVLLRRTREIELPLARVEEVLAGPPERAVEILREHATNLGERAARATQTASELIIALKAEVRELPDRTVLEVSGPELAAAVRQVRGAAGHHDHSGQGLLLEIDADGTELAAVGAGANWLAVRTVGCSIVDRGLRSRLPVATDDLDAVIEFGRRHDLIKVLFPPARSAEAAELRCDGDTVVLEPVPDLFPSQHAVLSELAHWRSRLIMDRVVLVDALRPAEGTIRLLIDGDDVELHRAGADHPVRLPAVARGASMTIAFDATVLLSAVEAGIGPDAMIELSGPDRPVLIRSADRGSCTVLIMPKRLAGSARLRSATRPVSENGTDGADEVTSG